MAELRLYKTELIRRRGRWRGLDDVEFAIRHSAFVPFDAAVAGGSTDTQTVEDGRRANPLSRVDRFGGNPSALMYRATERWRARTGGRGPHVKAIKVLLNRSPHLPGRPKLTEDRPVGPAADATLCASQRFANSMHRVAGGRGMPWIASSAETP